MNSGWVPTRKHINIQRTCIHQYRFGHIQDREAGRPARPASKNSPSQTCMSTLPSCRVDPRFQKASSCSLSESPSVSANLRAAVLHQSRHSSVLAVVCPIRYPILFFIRMDKDRGIGGEGEGTITDSIISILR